jgi:tRNA A37 threonylcarbamoyladenosine biosynthesis protein TsaE
VASPTFAIVNEYATSSGDVALRHLDLYRVEDTVEELEALGLPAIAGGAPAAVEWPGKAIALVLPATIRVSIEVLGHGLRRIRVNGGAVSPSSSGRGTG